MWPFRFVTILVCGRFVLWSFSFVTVSVCGRFSLWPFRSVAVSGFGSFGLWLFRLWPFRFVAVMTCYCGLKEHAIVHDYTTHQSHSIIPYSHKHWFMLFLNYQKVTYLDDSGYIYGQLRLHIWTIFDSHHHTFHCWVQNQWDLDGLKWHGMAWCGMKMHAVVYYYTKY